MTNLGAYTPGGTDRRSVYSTIMQRHPEVTSPIVYSPLGRDIFWGTDAFGSDDPVGEASPPMGQGQLSLDLFPPINHGDSNPAAWIKDKTLDEPEFATPMDLDTSSDDESLPELTRCKTTSSRGSSYSENTFLDLNDTSANLFDEVWSLTFFPSQVGQHHAIQPTLYYERQTRHTQLGPSPTRSPELPVNSPPLDVNDTVPPLGEGYSWFNGDMLGGEILWTSNLDGSSPETTSRGRQPSAHDTAPISTRVTNQGRTNLENRHISAPFRPKEDAGAKPYPNNPPSSPKSTTSGQNGASQWTRPWKREEYKEDGLWLCPRCERFLDRDNPLPGDLDEVIGAHHRLGISPPFVRKAGERLRRRQCGHCKRENFCHMVKQFETNW
ncbi:hypothetical protein BKA56DRAFT_40772 [Ilyonectria sp. MPI-CAGE-AT-0026]|nr:hypothetical protein BKA56DRAFT_40772 [Ilyonectria sp. MPI-CAGE-AT-0026]